MNTLSHEQAIQFLHEAAQHLSADQPAALAAHLAECDQCRSYADQLSMLQPVLTHTLHTRHYPPVDSSQTVSAILQHKRRSLMRKQIMVVDWRSDRGDIRPDRHVVRSHSRPVLDRAQIAVTVLPSSLLHHPLQRR